ncbi:MAG: hypothetical protein GX073_05725 [Firmicutes bacterium]|nr:hypothetical protein [Bacillota bacterium]
MRKAIIIICGFLLLIIGVGGLFLPVFVYFWVREWTSFLLTLGFPFFPVFYLPFTLGLLVTGGGLIARRQWAWYAVQTFWLFLLCVGVLVLVGFNLLSEVMKPLLGGGIQWRGAGNLMLGLLLIFVPAGGLVFFGYARQLFFTVAKEESPWARWSAGAEEQDYQW